MLASARLGDTNFTLKVWRDVLEAHYVFGELVRLCAMMLESYEDSAERLYR
jgi:hypothetical protein